MSDYILTLRDKKTGKILFEIDEVKFKINFQQADNHPLGGCAFSSMTVYGVEKKTCNHEWEIHHGFIDTYETCKICRLEK